MTGVCRVCGCTDSTPCMLAFQQEGGASVETPCWWEEADLCSGCKAAGEQQPESPLLYDAWGRPIDFGGGR